MELVVVVAIIGILAAIAIPGYNEQVRKTRRGTATVALLEVAQDLERFNTVNGTYIRDAGAGTNAPLCDRVLEFYTVSCTVLTANTFTLQAVPTNAQVGDRCGNYTYTQAAQRGLNGQQAGLGIADCW